LGLDTTYYWRIDEVNDADAESPWVGDVWSFTTERGNAINPSPPDNAVDVAVNAVLSWTAGPFAGSHNVYFGVDFDAVNNATEASAEYKGNQAGTSYIPGNLEMGETYYWRVDEVGATTMKGDVWTFSTVYPEPDYILPENITARASGVWYGEPGNWGPGFAADGSGLSGPDENPVHVGGSGTEGTMWMSNNMNAWIQFNFDKPYYLGEMWVWNFNQNPARGFKEVTIDYSPDGMNWFTLEGWVNKLTGTAEFPQAPGADGYAHDTVVDFDGTRAQSVRLTMVTNWGEGTNAGIAEVRFNKVLPRTAWEPNPAHRSENLPRDIVLGWQAGRFAVSHDVYLGTDEGAVTNATTSSPEYLGNQIDTSYSLEGLALGQTYYWRIDEVNTEHPESPWKGEIWRFRIGGAAYDPSPRDGAWRVPTDSTILSWTAGWGAASHDVYVGTDKLAVINATTGSPEYKGNLSLETTSFDPGVLEAETIYYWRIDELSDVTVKGDVWSLDTGVPELIKLTGVNASSNYPAREGQWLLYHVVDESGLSGPEHDPVHNAPDNPEFDTDTMWMTMGHANDTCVTFSFDQAYDLAEMWIWNFNQDVSRGIKTCRISYGGGKSGSGQVLGWVNNLTGLAEFARAPGEGYGAGDYHHNTEVSLAGINAQWVRFDFITTWGAGDVGLSEVRFYAVTPETAWGRFPGNALSAGWNTLLSWKAGREAISHDLYLGTDETAVADATRNSRQYKGNLPLETLSYDPGGLCEDSTYYWRVDELTNAGVEKGEVFSFTTGGFSVKVDLALPVCADVAPSCDGGLELVPGTARDGWEVLTSPAWTDMYMHDRAAAANIGGTGINASIGCGGVGNGGFHVHGLCRDNLGGGGCPSGSPSGEPIANGWYHNIDWGGEATGDILMRISRIPPGEYEMVSYHNHWEPASQGSRNCLDKPSSMPPMPLVAPMSVPVDPPGGYAKWDVGKGTGTGVESLQEAYNIKVTSVLSDDEVATSVIQFRTNGSDVLVIYDGGDNSYPDPARPGREGSKAVLNAFEIRGIVPPPPDEDGNGISDACEELEGCACPGDLNDDGQIDLEDLQAVAGILLDAGSPFIVPVEEGDCGDLNTDLQLDLEDLQAVAGILLQAGSPFVVPCE